MVHAMFLKASQFVEKVELYNREMAGHPRYKSAASSYLSMHAWYCALTCR